MPKTIQTSFALRQKLEDNSDFINKRLTRGKILQQFRKSYINAFEKRLPKNIKLTMRRKIRINNQILAKIFNNSVNYSLRSYKLNNEKKLQNSLAFEENAFNPSRTPTPVSKYNDKVKQLSKSDIARAKLMKSQIVKTPVREIIDLSDQSDNFPIKRCRTRVITRFSPKNQITETIDQNDINNQDADFPIKRCRSRVITRFHPKNQIVETIQDINKVEKINFRIKKCRTKVLTRSNKF